MPIDKNVETKDRIKGLRERMGMSRNEFCDYFGVPYRTLQDWELGNREMPDYLLRLMEYKYRIEFELKNNAKTDE